MSIPKATEFILALLLMVDAAWVADGLLHKRNMWKWISRYARTMMNGAENAGRNDSYIRANEMGIELEVTWLATLDERTRHSHRLLDRQTRPVDGCFEVDD